jgi:hypothetical protein
MRTLIWLVVALALLLGALYLYKNQRDGDNSESSFSDRKYSLEQLESSRDRMMNNIQKGKPSRR